MNRIYLLSDELGFEPTFFASIARFVLSQFSSEIAKVPCLKLLNWAYRESFKGIPLKNHIFVPARPSGHMDGNLLKGFVASYTVTNVALQAAYFMGFAEVILIGMDHSFKEKGTGAAAITSQGADVNHFHPNYFGKGVVWQLPDHKAERRGYRRAKELFERNGRKIVDATVDGKLFVFPKVRLEDYLEKNTLMNREQYLLSDSARNDVSS